MLRYFKSSRTAFRKLRDYITQYRVLTCVKHEREVGELEMECNTYKTRHAARESSVMVGIEGNAARYAASGSRTWKTCKDTSVHRDLKMRAATVDNVPPPATDRGSDIWRCRREGAVFEGANSPSSSSPYMLVEKSTSALACRRISAHSEKKSREAERRMSWDHGSIVRKGEHPAKSTTGYFMEIDRGEFLERVSQVRRMSSFKIRVEETWSRSNLMAFQSRGVLKAIWRQAEES
ncbi:hypothetical protein C8J57DRAFT_1221272 [Mycena rebaudengoi]|nr:hypothetical protein C8J57DRAFT_1221272 [Mycena rebaudengoi]